MLQLIQESCGEINQGAAWGGGGQRRRRRRGVRSHTHTHTHTHTHVSSAMLQEAVQGAERVPSPVRRLCSLRLFPSLNLGLLIHKAKGIRKGGPEVPHVLRVWCTETSPAQARYHDASWASAVSWDRLGKADRVRRPAVHITHSIS